MSLRFLVGGCIVCAIAAPSSVDAHDSKPIYRMVWDVASQNPITEATKVSPGAEVTRLKLVPPILYRASSDIVDKKGVVLVSAGMQLVGLQSDAVIACTIHSVTKYGYESISFLGSLKRVCLVDADRDGQFESHFFRSTNAKAYFILRGRLSGRQEAIKSVSLSPIPPEAIEAAPSILIKMSRSSRPGKFVELIAWVGKDNNVFPLIFRVRAEERLLPKVFEIYGAEVEIATNSAGDFTVRALSPFKLKSLDFWD